MNYLRGAVSAISAPYQYYKDINPSTLTGAIDVIVVKRPKHHAGDHAHQPEEETELVCSPFHVRFGKWQVLRPGDKKVNLFVNGNPVPFPMKIGEAGEAFFVFETDEEIPDNIATSPLLEATRPGQTNAQIQAGRFGAKEDGSGGGFESEAASQEPTFLDLNAASQDGGGAHPAPQPVQEQEENDSQGDDSKPSLLTRTAQFGKAVVTAAVEAERAQVAKLQNKSVTEAVSEMETDEREFLQETAAAARNIASNGPHNTIDFPDKGDEALPPNTEDVDAPEVKYTDNVALDYDGYHTRKGLDSSTKSRPERDSNSATSIPIDTPQPSRYHSPSPEAEAVSAPVPFPNMRAASEPPLDVLSATSTPRSSSSVNQRIRAAKAKAGPHGALTDLVVATPDTETPEYVWEWGNFPQRTPMDSEFRVPFPSFENERDSSTGDSRGKGRASSEVGMEADAILARRLAASDKKLSRLSKSYATHDEAGPSGQAKETKFGEGGRLTVDRRDPKLFRVFIEGKVVEFELSIVPGVSEDDGRLFSGEDAVTDAQKFDEGRIGFEWLLRNEHIVEDENLVVRWAGDMYIMRKDGSPIMDALVLWRASALDGRLARISSRSPSPGRAYTRSRLRDIDEETSDRPDMKHDTAAAAGDVTTDAAGKPSSSSWVRWWSRSRTTTAESSTRPDLRAVNTAPEKVETRKGLEQQKGASIKRSASAAPAAPTLSVMTTPDSSETTPTVEDPKPLPETRFAKTLRLTSEQLKSLDLHPGPNTMTFSLSATGAIACTARLFLWEHTDLVVVSDIDGTITKSDALGHVFTMIGRDWTHLGVAKLYTDITRNGYKIMYLTSRAIGQADSTRDYLKGIKQNDYQLPDGPVIMSPDRLLTSLHREVIMRKPEVFKMACLRDIQKLFGETARNPFYAGFGNRITDALSYRSVNIPSSRIFTIDSTGEVKMELLELAGYKSSYIHMTDLVDQMFPPIHRKWAPEYTDFNYWKPPMQEFALPDLSPPSPALSARSDTSGSALARLRNFSLVGPRPASSSRVPSLPLPSTVQSQKEEQPERRDQHLRQMSSFERLSSTLASLRLSSSSASSPGSGSSTVVESDDEDEGDLEGQKPARRRRSTTSMPGSLPGSRGSSDTESDMQFEMDGGGGSDYGGQAEEAAEDAFDEDILATGEMQNVPFL